MKQGGTASLQLVLDKSSGTGFFLRFPPAPLTSPPQDEERCDPAMMTPTLEEAKQLAQTCANRFPSHNTACLQAAQSPEDIAATERRTEQKAKSLTDKWFKKTR